MIKISGVTVKFPRSALPALREVELEIKSGQVGVLLGGNNSGKSTLLQTLSGLIPAMQPADISGSFEISGEVDALLQDSDIFLMPTVREELEFPLYKLWRCRITVTERLNWLAEKLRLEVLMNRQMHTLSGGERQRVALGAALAADQPVLLLDDPLSQLDAISAATVVSLLRELADQGKTILIASGSSYPYDSCADTYFWFKRGQLCWQGKPKQFREHHEAARLSGVDVDGRGLLNSCSSNQRVSADNLNINSCAAVSMNAVSHTYGEGFSLKSISMEVMPGQIVAVTGENGSGKTTLLKLAAGLLKPEKGTAKVFGNNLAGLSIAEATKQSGVLFQNPDHQLFQSRVDHELLWGLKKRGFATDLARQRIDKWLEWLELEHLAAEHPYSLSKTYRQWIALASIVVREPELLLLDEPTYGMDTAATKRFAKIITALNAEGMTVLLITHQKALAESCAHRIMKMDKGSLQQNVSGEVKK
jgi:energy-coupling factor transport system ATP-binding protein